MCLRKEFAHNFQIRRPSLKTPIYAEPIHKKAKVVPLSATQPPEKAAGLGEKGIIRHATLDY